jgi:hypothetical protein
MGEVKEKVFVIFNLIGLTDTWEISKAHLGVSVRLFPKIISMKNCN